MPASANVRPIQYPNDNYLFLCSSKEEMMEKSREVRHNLLVLCTIIHPHVHIILPTTTHSFMSPRSIAPPALWYTRQWITMQRRQEANKLTVTVTVFLLWCITWYNRAAIETTQKATHLSKFLWSRTMPMLPAVSLHDSFQIEETMVKEERKAMLPEKEKKEWPDATANAQA